MNYSAAQMVAIGGRLWVGRTGIRRVYFDVDKLLDIRVTRYGTGNIASATLDGEPISNSEARRLLAAKTWWQGDFIYINGRRIKSPAEAGRYRIIVDAIADAVEDLPQETFIDAPALVDCPRCGIELVSRDRDGFCWECGYDLAGAPPERA